MGLFDEQVARKPNFYPWTEEFIHRIWAGQWFPTEFNFKGDYGQFKSDLTDEERTIVVNTLSAIGQIEIAVKTFWAKLGENFPHPSIYDLGLEMAHTEVVHNKAYEKLLDVLQLGDVFEENLKNPIVKGRIDYLRKYLKKVYGDNQRKQYVYAIILFTLFVENVSLFSQFYVILWFNRFKNVLKDTAQQVQYTRQEESLHAQVGIKLINTLRVEYPELFDDELEARIIHECNEAYKAECKIVEWMVGDYQHEYMSANILRTFIKQRLNESLSAIGINAAIAFTPEQTAVFDKTKWMDEELYGNSHTDFFNKRPVEYAKKNKTYNEEDLF